MVPDGGIEVMTVGIAEFGVPVGEVKLDTDDVALEVVVGLPLSAKLSPDEVVGEGVLETVGREVTAPELLS